MTGSVVHTRLEICSVSHSNWICFIHFGDASLMTLTIYQKIVEIASDSLFVNIYRYFFIAQKGNGCLGRCARLHRTLYNCTGRPEQEDEERKNGTVGAMFGAQFKMNNNYTRIAAFIFLTFAMEAESSSGSNVAIFVIFDRG